MKSETATKNVNLRITMLGMHDSILITYLARKGPQKGGIHCIIHGQAGWLAGRHAGMQAGIQ